MTSSTRGPGPRARVLILYMESTGSGHRRAAEGIEAALARRTGVETELVNIVDYMDDGLHRLYQTLRTRILEQAPHVFGQLYTWYDQGPGEESFLDRLMFSIERTSLRRLLSFLKQSRHDVVIHTHFFPAELAAHLRRRQEISVPHMVVTTDFFSHSMWFHEPCERLFVATEEAGLYLQRLGAAPDRVELSGIPIDPTFAARRLDAEAHARETAQRSTDIATGARVPRVTFMATGLGPEVAAQAQASLLACPRPLHLRTLVGGDATRQAAVSAHEAPERHEVEILGQTDRVPDILATTDLLVGKAGGLTTAEATAMGCPMVILRPRPDQEEQNTDVLLERGAAVRAFRTAILGDKVQGVFDDLGRWRALRAGAHAMGRADAAERVADAALALARPAPRAAERARQARAK